jgi:hypothetical protein
MILSGICSNSDLKRTNATDLFGSGITCFAKYLASICVAFLIAIFFIASDGR